MRHATQKPPVGAAALAVSAGMATAQGVTISGDARFGIDHDDAREDANIASWQMTSRARVTFTLSGVTDTGLRFGASFRVDQAGDAVGNTLMEGGEVFLSGVFGTVTLGDTDSAALARVGDLAFTSLTGLGDPNEMVYLSRLQEGGFFTYYEVNTFEPELEIGRLTAMRYDHEVNGFTLSFSLDQLRTFDAVPGAALDFIYNGSDFIFDSGTIRVRGWSAGVSYDFGMGTVGIGYEALDIKPSDDYERFRASHVILGGETTVEGITLKAIYGRAGADLGALLRATPEFRSDQFGASVEASFDPVTVSAFANRDFFRTSKVGLGASLDLGGGAEIVGSVARTKGYDVRALLESGDTTRTSRTRADLGVSLAF